MQRRFDEWTGVGNVAFKGWAIGVACIYGVVTCLVAGIAALLVMIAPPTASISTGYSPRFSVGDVFSHPSGDVSVRRAMKDQELK